ncbi:hypothetical protein [Brooklawnia sp.]|uniref:hypothetical protein n=1 Tax=Brooklawnia sp. TaxID=2699740 RepID=UPI00311D6051
MAAILMHGSDDYQSKTRIYGTKIIGIGCHNDLSLVSCLERDVNINNVGMATAATQYADRSRGDLVKRRHID